MGLNIQNSQQEVNKLPKQSAYKNADLQKLFNLPPSPEKTKQIEEVGEEVGTKLEEKKQQVEEIVETPEEKLRLGMVLGVNAFIWKNQTMRYLQSRARYAKLAKEQESNQELIETYRTVGGVLNRLKANHVEMKDFCKLLPRKAAGMSKKIRHVEQKIMRNLPFDLVRSQHRASQDRIGRVSELMKKRGMFDSMEEYYSSTLQKADTKKEYSSAKDSKDKANAYLSHTLKKDLERVHAMDNYMLKTTIAEEKKVFGETPFAEKSIRINVLSKNVEVKDTKTDTVRKIPYEFDQDGFLLFQGEVSLALAMNKPEVKVQSSPEKSPESSQEEILKVRKPSLEDRVYLQQKFAQDTQLRIRVNKELNKDFFLGKTDFLTLQHGENPTEITNVSVKVKYERNEDETLNTIYYTKTEASLENNAESTLEPLLKIDSLGNTTWAQNAHTQNFQQGFAPRPIKTAEVEEAAKILREFLPEAAQATLSKSEYGIKQPFSWSSGAKVQTLSFETSEKRIEIPVVKDHNGDITLVVEKEKNIIPFPIKDRTKLQELIPEAS